MSDPSPPNPYTSPGYNPYAAPTAPAYAPQLAPLLQHEFFQHPAPVLRRIGAHLIDYAVLFVLILPVAVVAGLILDGTSTEIEDDVTNAITVVGFLPGLILQTILQATAGQSLGKLLCRIRVVTLDGRPAGFARVAFLRNLLPVTIQMFCGLLSLADALSLFRMDGRTIHDRLAATRVVRVD